MGGAPAQTTSRSCVCSRGRSASSSQWAWQPWKRAGGRPEVETALPVCTVAVWFVSPRLKSGIYSRDTERFALGTLASLPFPALSLKRGTEGQPLVYVVQSPRPGLPLRGEACWRKRLTRQQRASPATCIANFIHFK